MHLGNALTYLVAWAEAKNHCGSLVLRIDDLDERCHNKELQSRTLFDLEWLGIEWDGEVVWQSQNKDEHQDAINTLQRKNLLYPCFCSRADLTAASAPHSSDGMPIYDQRCRHLSINNIQKLKNTRPFSLRIKAPDKSLILFDDTYGIFEQNITKDVGDFIIMRKDGVIAYQLSVVVDDYLSNVNHVVRGSDLISSTPRQIWLATELKMQNKQTPAENCKNANGMFYSHVPLLQNAENQKLSKRDKALSISQMREHGYSRHEIIAIIAKVLGLADEKEVSPNEFRKLLNKRQCNFPKVINVTNSQICPK